MWVVFNGRREEIRFKVDTGCNALVLSHSSLKKLGFSASISDLAKLPPETGRLASGEKSDFKNLGTISLYTDKNQSVKICQTSAICHATRKTNDLIGTAVLKQFCKVDFNLTGNKYMELLKA
jgi:hypothetical protein